uniref:Choline transporter-like protein n=1 Tax=Pseudo-nitzschia australis TaxID=44445 RepID=A0A7S4EPH1_9STRA|mmetsp:Transcript_16982/g.35472  ORF Transcript_16982/g.35472 Transcript_16982/m.35472 type:complete len:471 (-) Transcript_16982:247-1659(-)|eukprot:CAMPEP_0168180330 /NCGR_PEP_ID=MMETSP0139_2-20121125/10453_1 /TAXON_ID=44445 /ORGANISM="Pseudo-nitzschia australis, Strain 10249 10 AB" /LENGTH=470 /DNA_ID=CAMNT_0008100487 /DNA_START=150 /DNA_END=1562 /DNA_ORIENTATION=-
MGEMVVVQGTTVPSGGNFEVEPTTNANGDNPDPAKTGCKDPIFAVLFYVNVIAILAVVAVYGVPAMNGVKSASYMGYVTIAAVFGILSLALSGVGLILLMSCPALIIKCGLIFSVVMSLLYCIYSFLFMNMFYGIIAVVFFMITVCYAKAVWSRIPFAAVNMLTAATAIKANLGVTFFAVFFTVVEVAWFVLWTIALSGVYDETVNCSDDGNNADGSCNINYGLLFLLFLSLYFTQQVLQSCVHVTVAGTVATWWVAPDESGCCSKAVCNSFIRTVTTSFGSICFGSLLVAILQALKAIASAAQSNDDMALLACIAQCIIGCLQRILEYFNKWAYIYVGVYGYSYIEAGKAVMQLFKDRGWEAIIADDLVSGAIFLVCVVIGLIIGGIGVALATINSQTMELAMNSLWAAFGIGFVAGLFVCCILLSTIASGVNTVLVMFADAPQEFQRNHPELSEKMRTVWEEFYPGSI